MLGLLEDIQPLSPHVFFDVKIWTFPQTLFNASRRSSSLLVYVLAKNKDLISFTVQVKIIELRIRRWHDPKQLKEQRIRRTRPLQMYVWHLKTNPIPVELVFKTKQIATICFSSSPCSERTGFGATKKSPSFGWPKSHGQVAHGDISLENALLGSDGEVQDGMLRTSFQSDLWGVMLSNSSSVRKRGVEVLSYLDQIGKDAWQEIWSWRKLPLCKPISDVRTSDFPSAFRRIFLKQRILGFRIVG